MGQQTGRVQALLPKRASLHVTQFLWAWDPRSFKMKTGFITEVTVKASTGHSAGSGCATENPELGSGDQGFAQLLVGMSMHVGPRESWVGWGAGWAYQTNERRAGVGVSRVTSEAGQPATQGNTSDPAFGPLGAEHTDAVETPRPELAGSHSPWAQGTGPLRWAQAGLDRKPEWAVVLGSGRLQSDCALTPHHVLGSSVCPKSGSRGSSHPSRSS